MQKQEIKRAALVLRATNHPLRQKMLEFLEQQGQKTVTEIYAHLKLEQSVASQHLAILRRAGIVSTTREGKYIFYSPNPRCIETINQAVDLLNSAA